MAVITIPVLLKMFEEGTYRWAGEIGISSKDKAVASVEIQDGKSGEEWIVLTFTGGLPFVKASYTFTFPKAVLKGDHLELHEKIIRLLGQYTVKSLDHVRTMIEEAQDEAEDV